MQNILSFLLSPKQMSEFKNLDPAGKVRFWYNFWAKNDSNPETPENEFMQEFIARWDYANAAFAQGTKTPGWKTDRGRIYIVYGPPDNVERHTFSSGTNNWEVWYYFDKNYYFIFADILGIGNMKLVDSNAPGEVHDRDWRNKIKGYHIQPSPQDRGY
ncbi:MAG TPA: GWxTD domain-containing protein [candidate division Zixibacteria bacterium]|nr:GWxTD domain-containing protein [candidate division Zixibacteria bacterium]